MISAEQGEQFAETGDVLLSLTRMIAARMVNCKVGDFGIIMTLAYQVDDGFRVLTFSDLEPELTTEILRKQVERGTDGYRCIEEPAVRQ